MKLIYIALPALLMASAIHLHAADAQTSPIFRSIADSIVANNPALCERRASLESNLLNLRADNNLNDPEIEAEHQWGQGAIGNKWSVSVKQSFDWPGLYGKRSAAAKSAANAYSLLLEAEETDLRRRVAATLISYVTARGKVELGRSVCDNLDSVSSLIRRAYDCNEATVLDLRKINLERAEATTRLEDAELAVDRLRQELIAMNGGKYIDLTSVTEYPEMTLHDESLYADMLENADPDIAAAAGMAETARLTAAAERMRSLPGFSLGYIHNVEIGDHFNGITGGITLPFFSGRNRSAAAKAESLAAEYRLDDVRSAARNRMYTDYATAKSCKRRIAAYDGMFGDSDDYTVLLYKSFIGGQMTVVTYLYELNYYISAKTSYLDLMQDYAIALASLNRYENEL